MAQARRRGRQSGAARGLPGWAMLAIGLIIGLFVAFLVYLDDLEAPPGATAEAPDAEPSAGSSDDDGGAEAEGPRFEFYSILPELEVVVPDLGGGGSEGPREAGPDAEDAAPAESTDAPAQATPAPADGGRYFLQAGSFRKAAQADRLKAEIALLGLDVAIQDVRIDGEQWHRVRIGPYQASGDLEAAQTRLRDHEIDYLVMREKGAE